MTEPVPVVEESRWQPAEIYAAWARAFPANTTTIQMGQPVWTTTATVTTTTNTTNVWATTNTWATGVWPTYTYTWTGDTAETEDERQARADRVAENERAYAARMAADRARRLEREAQREAAEERATELLFELLTEAQAETWRERNFFEVVGSNGGHYRIYGLGQAGNVYIMDADEITAECCAHPDDYLPHPDAYVAQMLALETDEAAFLQVANITRRWRPATLPGERVA